jgi:hypothetical protein
MKILGYFLDATHKLPTGQAVSCWEQVMQILGIFSIGATSRKEVNSWKENAYSKYRKILGESS